MCGVQKLSTARFQFLNKHSWTIDCSIGGSPSWWTNHWVKDIRINESTAWSKCEKTDTDATLTRDFDLFLVTLLMLDSAWMWLVPMKSTHVSRNYKLCARWRSQTAFQISVSYKKKQMRHCRPRICMVGLWHRSCTLVIASRIGFVPNLYSSLFNNIQYNFHNQWVFVSSFSLTTNHQPAASFEQVVLSLV